MYQHIIVIKYIKISLPAPLGYISQKHCVDRIKFRNSQKMSCTTLVASYFNIFSVNIIKVS